MYNICRLCMHVGGSLIPIFSQDKVSNISDTIMSCAIINISKEDGLPENICLQCSMHLKDALAFKNQCERTDKTLRKLFLKTNNCNENIGVDDKNIRQEISEINKNINSTDNSNKILLQCKSMHDIHIEQNSKTELNNMGKIKGFKSDNTECILAIKVHSETTKNEDQLNSSKRTKLHYGSLKSQVRKHSCVVCLELFSNLKDLKDHRSNHKGPYKCKFCIRETPTWTANINHERSHRNDDEKIMICEMCNKEFQSMKSLRRHKVIHTGDGKHSCSMCTKEFSDKSNLKRHMLIHQNIKPYICKICDQKFTRAEYLKDHLNIGHSLNLQLHSCSICEYKNVRKAAIRAHMLSKHFVKVDIDINKTGANTQKEHLICTICEKVLGSTRTLKVHMRTHTNSKGFLCRHCGKSFNLKSGLESHERIHTGEKPYKCRLCNKPFRHQVSVDTHMFTHTGERPHQCKICLKRFSQMQHLRRHLRIHTGERKHVCDICKKAFAQRDGLRYHKMTHTGEMPNICEICGRGFYIPYKLKVHMRNSHSLQMEEKKEPAEVLDQDLHHTKIDEEMVIFSVEAQVKVL